MHIAHIFSFHFRLSALAVPFYSTMSTMGRLLLYSELSTHDPHLRHGVRDGPLRRLVVLGDKAQLFLHRSGLCTVCSLVTSVCRNMHGMN